MMRNQEPHPAERSYSMPIIFEVYGEDDGPDLEYGAYDEPEDFSDDPDDDFDEAEDERAPLDITVVDDDGPAVDLPEGTHLSLTPEAEDA